MNDKQPTNHGNWGNKEEVGVYWLMRLALLLHLLLGGILFPLILYPIVSYYFVSNKEARKSSILFLQHIENVAPHTQIRATFWFSFLHFMQFAQSILDKFSAWGGRLSLDKVDVHGREEFINSLDQQQGALILGAHLGNTEVMRALATLNQRAKLNILVHTKHAKNFNRLLNNASSANTMELIQVTDLSPGIAILLDQKISQGEFVFIVGDRIPVNNTGRTLMAPFLGEPAPFAQGPFILASLLKCPVYTLFCIKTQHKYQIYFEHFADRIKLPRKNREEALQSFINNYAARLEKYCLMAPLQWFNFYPYWQTSPDNHKA